VEDTDTADFDALVYTDVCMTLDTSGDQMTGSNACYDATGICGDFLVLSTDRSTLATWATAMSYCDSLLPNL